MTLYAEKYDTALQQGAKIKGTNLDSATVTGANTTLTKTYSTIAVGTQGTTQVNVFGATAPIAGTITGFWLTTDTATGSSAGTITLWATTAGTIATIANTGTTSTAAGLSRGTGVLSVAIVAGDSVYVKGVGAGTSTAFITFVSAN